MIHKQLIPFQEEMMSHLREDFNLKDDELMTARDIVFHTFTATFLEFHFQGFSDAFFDIAYHQESKEAKRVKHALIARCERAFQENLPLQPRESSIVARQMVRFCFGKLKLHFELLSHDCTSDRFLRYLLAS